jgi:hypothetical protein
MDNQNPSGAGGGYPPSGAGYPAPGGAAPGSLDVQDVISTTFRTLGPALAPILGSALLIAVPTSVVSFVFQVIIYLVAYRNGTPDMEALQIAGLIGSAAWLVSTVVLIMAHAIGQGGIMYAVAEHLSGRRASFGQTLRVALARSPQAIATGLLTGIPIAIGLFMCIAPGIVLMVFFCVALPVCIVERLGPIDSVTRSIALTEGNRLQIFLIGLALMVGLVVASCCLIGPVMGIVTVSAASHPGDLTALQNMQNPFSWQQLLIHLTQFPMLVVNTMVQATTVAVIYARLRGLRDGVDAQAIASVFT